MEIKLKEAGKEWQVEHFLSNQSAPYIARFLIYEDLKIQKLGAR